jgi:hypothetical protein
MTEEHDHAECVEAWSVRVAGDQSGETLLREFERGFRAVWRRAHVTLGDITLMAVGDRVLHVSVERYPFLASLRLEPLGISCEDLERDASEVEVAELDAAVRFVLVELLTVLGRLTGDVLTPALHAELSADHDADQESGP